MWDLRGTDTRGGLGDGACTPCTQLSVDDGSGMDQGLGWLEFDYNVTTVGADTLIGRRENAAYFSYSLHHF